MSFPFLLDEDRAVTKAYGLYHRLGKDAINIAHPATLVIDSGGTVRYIYRGENQTDRAPLEKVFGGSPAIDGCAVDHAQCRESEVQGIYN